MNNLRTDIQVLRGIAVISVVLFHNFKTFFPNGYLGVDVFFVVSGYVVTPIILSIFLNETNRVNPRILACENLVTFFFRRFARLAPALTVTLAFFSIITLLIGPLSEHSRSINQAIFSLFIAGNYGAWKYQGDYFNSNPNQFVHTWSLSVEGQIYLILPLILYILFIRLRIFKSKNHAMKFFKMMIIISILSGIILKYFSLALGIDNINSVLFYSPIIRIVQFMLGGLLSLINRPSQILSYSKNRFNWIPIILLIILLFIDIGTSFLVGISCATFLSLYLINNDSINILPKKLTSILSRIGNMSYSIYLVHMPISTALETFPIFFGTDLYLQKTFSLLATIVSGYLLYTKVENKFRYPNNQIEQLKTFKRYILVFLIMPLIALFVSLIIIRDNYFGLGTRDSLPIYAPDKINCNLGNNKSPCLFNSQASNGKILLIGDSQAGALALALISWGIEYDHQIHIWVRPSCGFVLLEEAKKFSDFSLQKFSPGCLEHNNRITNWLENNSNTRVVIANTEGSSRNEVLANLESIKHLSKNSRRILFIGDIPRFPNDDDFLSKNETLINYTEDWLKEINENRILLNDPFFTTQLNHLNRNENFQFLDPKEKFCELQVCTRFANNTWLYFDSTHLSVEGAKFLFNRSLRDLDLFLTS